MTHELQRVYRPKTLSDVIGQKEAIHTIQESIRNNKLPHAITFIGNPGVGKTTLARILARDVLKCGKLDYEEINCAIIDSPIDKVKEIQQRLNSSPVTGPVRVYVLDEVQALSRAGFAQQGLLKVLEEPPSFVYFFLCTTDPTKVIKAIRSRCKEIVLKAIPDKDMTDLLSSIVKKEKSPVTADTIAKIVDIAQGGARDALKLLGSVISIKTEDEQLEAIQSSSYERQSIELCRALLNPKSRWSDVAKILQGVDEEPETMRRMVLGYMTSVMLKGGKNLDRVHAIIQIFEMNYFDSGKAGLVSACYQVVGGNK